MLNWDYLVFSGLTVPDVPPTSFSSIQPMLTVALHHFLLNVRKDGEQESRKKFKTKTDRMKNEQIFCEKTATWIKNMMLLLK